MPAKSNSSSLRDTLHIGTLGSIGLKLSQTTLGFFLSVLLARILGAEGFGIYAFCISIVSLLTIPAMLGGQPLLVREVAANLSLKKRSQLRGLLRWVLLSSSTISLLLSFIAAMLTVIFFENTQTRDVFLLSLCLVPLIAIVNLFNASLRGLHHVLLGQISFTFVPALFILALMISFILPQITITPSGAIIIYTTIIGVMAIITGIFLSKCLPSEILKYKPTYDINRWIKSMLPFLFSSFMLAANNEVSIIVLKILQGSESAGIFRIAQRCAELISLGLIAINMTIGPSISKFYAKGEIRRLQSTVNHGSLFILIFALPSFLALILLGRQIIPYVFGVEYMKAYIPLVILSSGQLFNAAMGSVGLILNMIGMERIVSIGITIAAVISIFLNLFFVPIFNTIGAALATVISIVIWNLFLSIYLYKKTGIISLYRLKYFCGLRNY